MKGKNEIKKKKKTGSRLRRSWYSKDVNFIQTVIGY